MTKPRFVLVIKQRTNYKEYSRQNNGPPKDADSLIPRIYDYARLQRKLDLQMEFRFLTS